MEPSLKISRENTNEALMKKEPRTFSSFDGIETTQGPGMEIGGVEPDVKDKNSLLLLNEILKSQ